MTSLILNVTVHMVLHNDPIETSGCFMLGKICSYLAIYSSIGKSDSPSIVDLMICPLGKFSLIIFVVGRTLFRWEDSTMKFPVQPESAKAEFPPLFIVYFLCLALMRDCGINVYFQIHCKFHHYSLMNYIYDYLPCISFILFSILVLYCF